MPYAIGRAPESSVVILVDVAAPYQVGVNLRNELEWCGVETGWKGLRRRARIAFAPYAHVERPLPSRGHSKDASHVSAVLAADIVERVADLAQRVELDGLQQRGEHILSLARDALEPFERAFPLV